MKRTLDPRSLLLEQLEVRRMLAAGLQSHTGGSTNHGFAPQQAAEVHRVRNDAIPHTIRAIARQDQRPTADFPARLDRHHGMPGRLDPPPLRMQVQTPPIVVPLYVSELGTNLHINRETLDQSSTQVVVVIDLSNLPFVGTPPPRSSSNPSDTLISVRNGQSKSPPPSFTSVEIDSNPEKPDARVEVIPPVESASIPERESQEAVREAVSDARRITRTDGSFVESISSSRPFAFNPPNNLGDGSVWEIDAESIQRLREILREDASRQETLDADQEPETREAQSLRHNSSAVARPTDTAITDWLGEATGWIELDDHGSMPFPNFAQTQGEIVDVVLKATLGWNQRIELMASERGSTSDAACRDQVLAVLAEERARTAESIDPAPVRASTVAYSAATAAAGVLAVARRQRKVAMFRTAQAS